MTETEHAPEVLPAVVSPVEMIQAEADLRRAMVAPTLKALDRPGAVVVIQGGKHVTIKPLTEIAAHLAVSIDTTEPTPFVDPVSNEPAARVRATATRRDGVYASANGICSTGEEGETRDGRKFRRWPEWHACVSMAETRARVRALSALLAPIIVEATEGNVSVTPAETMPWRSDDDRGAPAGRTHDGLHTGAVAKLNDGSFGARWRAPEAARGDRMVVSVSTTTGKDRGALYHEVVAGPFDDGNVIGRPLPDDEQPLEGLRRTIKRHLIEAAGGNTETATSAWAHAVGDAPDEELTVEQVRDSLAKARSWLERHTEPFGPVGSDVADGVDHDGYAPGEEPFDAPIEDAEIVPDAQAALMEA